MAMNGTPNFPKLQHYWNLTIRLFRIISRTHVARGVLFLCREAVGVFYNPSRQGNLKNEIYVYVPSSKPIFWIRTFGIKKSRVITSDFLGLDKNDCGYWEIPLCLFFILTNSFSWNLSVRWDAVVNNLSQWFTSQHLFYTFDPFFTLVNPHNLLIFKKSYFIFMIKYH